MEDANDKHTALAAPEGERSVRSRTNRTNIIPTSCCLETLLSRMVAVTRLLGTAVLFCFQSPPERPLRDPRGLHAGITTTQFLPTDSYYYYYYYLLVLLPLVLVLLKSTPPVSAVRPVSPRLAPSRVQCE